MTSALDELCDEFDVSDIPRQRYDVKLIRDKARARALNKNVEQGKRTRKMIYDLYVKYGGDSDAIKRLALVRHCTVQTIRVHLRKYYEDIKETK